MNHDQLDQVIRRAAAAPPQPPQGPRSRVVARLEAVGLDIRIDPLQHELVIQAIGDEKFFGIADAIAVPMAPSYAQGFLEKWHQRAEELAQQLLDAGGATAGKETP